MPRKRKNIVPTPVDTAERPHVNPDWLDAAGLFKLPPHKYWQYRALTAELEASGLRMQVAKTAFEDIVRSTPSLVALRQDISAAKAASTRTTEELKVFQDEVQEATGLDLANAGIDDTTGHIKQF